MIRIRMITTVPFIVCGCQYAQQAETPPDLDVRLSALERSVMTGKTDDVRHARNRTSDLSSSMLGHATPRATLGHATPTDASITWSLSDFSEDALQDNPAGDDRSEIRFADKADQYLRRPPLLSFWDTVQRDIEYLPADLWRDTKRVYANPTHLAILGVAYGGSLALQQTGPDSSVEHHFRGAHRHMSGDWRDAFGAAGNPATHFGLAGIWYLVGQQTMDDKTYEVGKTLFSALAINGMTVLAGQAATFDRGPNGERGTFPSGHTSSSFVVASVLHEAYGHAVGIPLYGLAALVAHERLEDGEHYLSDVVMGAVLGTLIGHSVASGRDPEFFGWRVMPYVGPEGATGLAFMKTLP